MTVSLVTSRKAAPHTNIWEPENNHIWKKHPHVEPSHKTYHLPNTEIYRALKCIIYCLQNGFMRWCCRCFQFFALLPIFLVILKCYPLGYKENISSCPLTLSLPMWLTLVNAIQRNVTCAEASCVLPWFGSCVFIIHLQMNMPQGGADPSRIRHVEQT